MLNLIPFNSLEGNDIEGVSVEGEEYQRPEYDRITEIIHYLHQHGVLATVRNSAGQDIDGGCGQLRARAVLGTDLIDTVQLHG